MNKRVNYVLNKLAICSAFTIYCIFIQYFFTMNQFIPAEVNVCSNPKDLLITDHWLKNFVRICFDLNISECGGYRPRILSFMIQTIDENLQYRFSNIFSFQKTQLPLSLIVIGCIPISLYRLLKETTKKISKELLFLMSSTILLSEPIITELTYRTRTSKFLTIIVAIELIRFVFYNYKITKKQILSVGIFIGVLCSLDEMIFAECIFLCTVSGIYAIQNKEYKNCFVSLCMANMLFVLWYFVIGKYIFTYYTGSFREHGHATALTENAQIICIAPLLYCQQIQCFVPIIKNLGIMFLIYVSFIYPAVKFIASQKTIGKILNEIILIIYPFALLSVVCISHPPIFIIKGLHLSLYTLPSAIVILFMFFRYLGENRKLMILIAVLFIVSIPVNIYSFNIYKTNLLPISHGSQFMEKQLILKNEHGTISTMVVPIQHEYMQKN